MKTGKISEGKRRKKNNTVFQNWLSALQGKVPCKNNAGWQNHHECTENVWEKNQLRPEDTDIAETSRTRKPLMARKWVCICPLQFYQNHVFLVHSIVANLPHEVTKLYPYLVMLSTRISKIYKLVKKNYIFWSWNTLSVSMWSYIMGKGKSESKSGPVRKSKRSQSSTALKHSFKMRAVPHSWLLNAWDD